VIKSRVRPNIKHRFPIDILSLRHADHAENAMSRVVYPAGAEQRLVTGFTFRALSKYAITFSSGMSDISYSLGFTIHKTMCLNCNSLLLDPVYKI
jgi:hypothetical protein